MRIKRLRFEGFGCFNLGLDVSFQEGLNVILGPNESGKTTMVEGLIGVLFGLRDREAEMSYRPRGVHGAWTGEVEIQAGDVEYHLARDFETHRVLVTMRRNGELSTLYQGDANPRGRTDDLVAYLGVVEKITGLRDREMALRSLFMKQGELETAVDEQVRHLLSGAARGDHEAVLERLEEQHFALTRENPWGRRKNRPREIEELEEKLADLTTRRDRARQALESGGKLVGEMEEAATAVDSARAAAGDAAARFGNYSEFFEIHNERGELEKRLRTLREEVEKIKGLVADCRRVEADLWPRYEVFRRTGPEFGESLRALGTLQREVADLADEYTRGENTLNNTPWPRNLRRGLLAGAITAVVVFAGAVGAGRMLWGVAGGITLGVVAFLVVYLLGKGRERARVRLEGQVVEMSDRLEKRRAELERLEADLKPIVGDRRLREVLEEFRDFREKADLLSRYEQIRESHRSPAEAEADYEGVFQKLKLADSRARDLIARAPYLVGADENLDQTAASLEKVRREKEEAEGLLRRAESSLGDLKLGRARQEGAQVDDVESLEEDLNDCRDRKARLEARRDALRAAIEVLRDCIAGFQEGHVERLTGRAGDLMRRVTDGRYHRVVLDGSFEPCLLTKGGEEFAPGQVSRGAQDQLHLALRLAITAEIQGAAGHPILMDDVLVNCDADRLDRIRRLLEEMVAEGRQVLLFAHDPAYRAWGRVALELPGGARNEAIVSGGPADTGRV